MNEIKNLENNNGKILIAEDSSTQSEQLKYLLEKHNYHVIAAKDGKEALGLIIKHKPSLVISDIIMPEMNGYELCKEIKSNESIMDIPVILLTSLTRSEDILEGISCGADNFITKPYNENYLISHIEQILANRKIYKNERVRVGVEILFGGKRRFITASQQQMLTLLISTYEAAVQRNDELIQTQEDLKKLNGHLEELVLERTAELMAENEIRKRAEERVVKLNRVYAVLSNINQTIVRIHNPNQLLKDSCRIAIDVGKFQSAWIGFVNNKTNKIETYATAGLTNDYFNNVVDDPADKNPITNVIRSGKHFMSNNINDDKSIDGIWKHNALSLGFRSFVVFPIKVHEKILGCFCIYSNEVDYFDEIEICLLDEMATDISFALEFIHNEIERKNAEGALKDSEAKQHAILDAIPDMMFRISCDGVFLDFQAHKDSDLYVSPDAIVGHKLHEIFPPEFAENALKHICATIENGTLQGFEYSLTMPNGIQHFDARIVVSGKDEVVAIVRNITERKLAEEKLIESEERYKRIASGITDYLYTVKIKNKKVIETIHNDASVFITGYKSKEFAEDPYLWINMVVPEEKEFVINKIGKIIEGNDLSPIEHRIICKNGKIKWIRDTAIPKYDSNGELISYDGVIKDITESKRSEEALRGSEEKFSSAFRSASYAITITRIADGKIIDVNDSFYSVTGYTIEETIGKTTIELKLWADENDRNYVVSELSKGKRITSREFPFRKKSGDVLIGLFSAEIINIQNENCILSSINDITDRKHAEEEIISQKNKFAQLFDNSPISIALLDTEDRIVLINESFSQLFGYYFEEVKGKFLTDVIVPPELREEAKSYSDQTREGNYLNKESYRRKKDGTDIYVQIIGVPVEVNNKTVGIYGIYADLTQRKKNEEELIKAKEHSEELNKLKSCFLTNMSHELRTPLISVLGFAELLQNELKNSEHLEFVNNIIEGGQRLNNTLSEILEISKLETARSFLKLKPYNLADEIKRRVTSFTPMAQSKRLFLKTELSDTNLNANIDAELFGKALYHLISNALKFTKEGGVFVSLNHARKQDRDWAVTTVIDTGIGIPKKNLDKIFDEFRQVDEGFNRSHEGTGLGLTIAKRIVELMEGYIQVESEIGKGSSFSIWLPALLDERQIKMKIEEKQKTIIIEPPSIKEKGLKKVLIVDDNSSNRLFMNHCLSSYFRIIEAADGITGVTFASKEHFDLILMDINLGAGIDGVEAMRQIKNIPGYTHVPIIAVTAYVMFGDMERFLSEGFDYYLAKPFTRDTLVSLIEKNLAKDKK